MLFSLIRMSSFQIPDECWEEDYDWDLPIECRYWRAAPPTLVDDIDGSLHLEHAFEEGSVSITINHLVRAHRAWRDSIRERRHAATDALVETGEFRLHRPPDEDTEEALAYGRRPLARGAFAEVSAVEYDFVRGYVLHGSAHFWAQCLPDWRRVQETQSLINYFWNIERDSEAFWDFSFRYIPGQDPEVEAFIQIPF